MAEAEQGDKGVPPQRRRYQQTRPIYSNRGRGRYDPHVSKALHNFGVTDLRDWLDKKHQQEGQIKSGAPPPDPSYNYLKDPSRENINYDGQARKYQKERSEGNSDYWPKSRSPRGSKSRSGGMNRDSRRLENEKTSFIQNPINIKIELQTATGERSCKLDEERKLADIKHTPDHKQQERRTFWSERSRGKGESGRGRGPRVDDNKDRTENERSWHPKCDYVRGKNDSERGKEGGRGGRGRSRGRGDRGAGRGRGQGKYNSNTYRNKQQMGSNLPQNIPVAEVPTEEDWDNECIIPPPEENDNENMKNKQEENEENFEEPYIQEQEYYEEEYREDFHDYEEGDEEYLEATGDDYEVYPAVAEKSHELKENESDTELNLQENLIITSTEPQQQDENGKRTVRFKLDEEEDVITRNIEAEHAEPVENLKLAVAKDGKEQKKQEIKDEEPITSRLSVDKKMKPKELLNHENSLKSKTEDEVCTSKDASSLEKKVVKEGNVENADKEDK